MHLDGRPTRAWALRLALFSLGSSGCGGGPRPPDGGTPTAISCATLATNPTLTAGQQLVLDLTGAPTCTLPASTDLVIGGVGTQLLVANGTLEVRGNITLSGSGVFTVAQGTLQIDNQTNFAHGISASDTAGWVMNHAALVTNATGVNNVASVYTGTGSSSAQFNFATVESTTSWLLATTKDDASLFAANSNVPNEIYLDDRGNVEIQDDQVPTHPRSANGLWLRFVDAQTATIDLPDVTSPFSWSVGRGQPGFTNVGWHLQVDAATPGLGVEVHAGAAVVVNGRNAARKEIGFGVYVDPAAGSALATAAANTPYQLADPPLNSVATYALPLLPGATKSQLTLHQVNVGPLAWQVYAGGGLGAPPVTVNLGTGLFNEVAAFAGGHLNLMGSTTQLAVVEATGPGAIVNAVNADLWSQTIQADSAGQVNVIGSVVHGGSLVASAGGTLQLDDTTALWANGATTSPDCAPGPAFEWLAAHGGKPICNPFARPGQLSTRTIVGQGSTLMASHSHPVCAWAGTRYVPALSVEVGPAVSAAAPGTLSCTPPTGPTTSSAVSAYPMVLSDLQGAVTYACSLSRGSAQQRFSVLTSACVE